MNTVAYVRVSTEEQTKEGISLELQEDRIRSYCRAKGWDSLQVIRDEGFSAKNLNRPGVKKLIAMCKVGECNAVVTLKLDRLTRSVRDLGYLIDDVFNRNGVAFSSVMDNFDTSTANGRLIMHILGTLAAWERETISERTREGMAYLKENRKLVGAVPYGYDLVDGNRLEPNPDEQIVIEVMKTMRDEGNSYKRIADQLNTQGIPAKQGGKWYSKTVRSTLTPQDNKKTSL